MKGVFSRCDNRTKYHYDANGNLIEMDEVQFFANANTGYQPMYTGYTMRTWIDYSVENMPTEIFKYDSENGASLTFFTYDPSNSRAAKHSYNFDTANDMSTYYVSDAYEVEYVNGKEIFTKYIFAGNQRVAKITTLTTGFETINYIHKDHLGSTTVVTDEFGNTLEDFGQPELTQYRPYGTTRAGYENRVNTITDYNFTDQELDHSTGLYNYDARLYNPDIAMFVTADSLLQNVYDPQLLNRYAIYHGDHGVRH